MKIYIDGVFSLSPMRGNCFENENTIVFSNLNDSECF